MATYTKNGQLHGIFDSQRHSKFEHIGRDAVIYFWESKGWKTYTNDIDESGNVVKNRADLKVEMNNRQMLMEAATKRNNLFSYIKSGVDVETRKLKYRREGERAFVAMCDYGFDGVNAVAGNEMLLIPMECLEAAQNDCGNNYKGMGSVSSSYNFSMPDHSCHRVRKRCSKGLNQDGSVEDFYRIPYEYVAHYRKNEDGNYKLISKPIWRIKDGRQLPFDG